VAFEQLKERQSVVWGTGPYQNVTETIADIHESVVERLDPKAGERMLDVACGTGAVAELAARRGARVTGADLAPALIETATARAAEQGLEIDYEVGDCENLRFEDGAFDVVASTCGVMFAPDHAATASELARVTAGGGRLALACWTPTSTLARMFAVMRPYSPPPPNGVGSPFAWGDEEHLRELLGDAFELTLERRESVLRVPSGQAAWELFSHSYGPTRILAESLEDDRRAELARDFAGLHDEYAEGDGVAMPREYLLVLGIRR